MTYGDVLLKEKNGKLKQKKGKGEAKEGKGEENEKKFAKKGRNRQKGRKS